MSDLTSEQLKQIAPHLPAVQREQILPALKTALAQYGITTYLRVAAFLGQTLEESNEFTHWEENLNYSAGRLMQVWPRRFPTLIIANQFAHNPQVLAEKVYGGRMGNVNPGDGYKYRGRGPEQTTGHDGYESASEATGLDLLANPDLVAQPEVGFKVAAADWKKIGANELADKRQFKTITVRINGGLTNYDQRLAYYTRALRVLPEDLMIGPLVLPDGVPSTSPAIDNSLSDIHVASVSADFTGAAEGAVSN